MKFGQRTLRGDVPPVPLSIPRTTELSFSEVREVERFAKGRHHIRCSTKTVPLLLKASPGVIWRGTEYEVDLSEVEAWSGYQWSYGTLQLEQNPDLYPLSARGHGIDPGHFYALKNISIIEAALEDAASAVTSAPYRIEPPALPDWNLGKEDHELALARHTEFARRVWREWTKPDKRYGLTAWAGDMIRCTPMAGFCLHEIIYHEVKWQLVGDDSPQTYWVPEIEFRTPWSVSEWIIQGNEACPVGVVLINTQMVDSTGERGTYYTVLPAEKFLHVMARDMGRNAEGRSHLRSAWTPANKLSKNNQIEGLSNEVNGLGTWIFKPGRNGWDPDELDRLVDHLKAYKAGHVPFIILDDPDIDVDIVSPNSQVKDFSAPINRDTQAVLMALNSEDKMIGVTKHGSHAARESASEDAWKPYGVMARDYVALPMQELLARALRLNFPEDDALDRLYATSVHVGAVEKQDQTLKINNLATAKEKQLLDDPRTREATAEALNISLTTLEPETMTEEVTLEQEPVIAPSRAPLMTPAQVASMLGVGAATIRNWAKDGRLPAAASVAGRLRFRIEDVEEFAAPGLSTTPVENSEPTSTDTV